MNVSKCALLAWSAVMAVVVANAIEAREWKDSTGKESREGEFIALRDGQVYVRLVNGHDAVASLEKFCDADQGYVKNLVASKQKAILVNAEVGELPSPVRLANFQPGTTASTGPAAEADVVAKYGNKFVFRTFCSRFHIILGQPGVSPIIGTAHYAFEYWTPCCGCCCCCTPCCGPFYLSFLKLTVNNRSYIEAEEVGGTSDVKLWRFWWVPDCCCKYKVEYTKDGKKWYLYDYCTRTTPR